MDETFEVILTPKAEKNLEEIIDYLLLNVSWESAEKVKNGLLKEIEKLSQMPTANGIAHEFSNEDIIYRKRLKWSYRIVFLIDENEKIVFVTSIQNTRQSPENLSDI